jgi:hypothetical protein
MIDCSTRSVRKAIVGAARALCSGATRRGKVLEFTQLRRSSGRRAIYREGFARGNGPLQRFVRLLNIFT